MTKYTTLENKESKPINRTEFYSRVGTSSIDVSPIENPYGYDNVIHIGSDKFYGDVFKAWNDGEENDFVLFFGEKGDEFNI